MGSERQKVVDDYWQQFERRFVLTSNSIYGKFYVDEKVEMHLINKATFSIPSCKPKGLKSLQKVFTVAKDCYNSKREIKSSSFEDVKELKTIKIKNKVIDIMKKDYHFNKKQKKQD